MLIFIVSLLHCYSPGKPGHFFIGKIFLFEAGARICKSEGLWGVQGIYLGETKDGQRIYSGDEIEVNNVKLPLADAPESYFSREIEIV